MATSLTINGEQKSFDAPADMPLLWVLRDILGMTCTKFGCGIAACGACTVHIDGKPVRSCMLPVGAVRGRAVTPIKGIGASPVGAQVQLVDRIGEGGQQARPYRDTRAEYLDTLQLIPVSLTLAVLLRPVASAYLPENLGRALVLEP